MEIPPVLLSRCPGCARPLPQKSPGCAACGLGVAGVPQWWSRDEVQTERLWPYAVAAGATAFCALAAAVVVLLVPNPPVLLKMAAFTAASTSLLVTAIFLWPWGLVLFARLRKVSSWTFATEWSNDARQGYVQTRVLLVNGQVAHASGQFTEYDALPSARRFGSRAAPLSSQRRFVRWLMNETMAGRARVAELRKIEWEINGPAPLRGVFTRPAGNPEPTRKEERRLMVAAEGSGEGGPSVTAGDTVYSAHLKEPRPVADLWFALSRQAETLPDARLGEHEIPEWAHELEAALTAEVAPLVMN